jgi:signal recognition particle subunit SRP54
MVLAELGTRLQGALAQLNRTTVVDDEAFNALLKEICGALLESDVQVKLVRQLRDNVKLAVSLEDASSGANRRRLIQKSIVDQLVQMLEPEAQPYKMKKGQSNVIMFVGLQDHEHRQIRSLLPAQRLEDGHGVCRYVPCRCFRPAEAELHQVAHPVLR